MLMGKSSLFNEGPQSVIQVVGPGDGVGGGKLVIPLGRGHQTGSSQTS